MGCGTSQQAYEPELPGYKGLINIEVIGAKLTRDVKWVGSMDTYVKLILDKQTYQTEISSGTGKYPKWPGSNANFKKRADQDDVIIGEVWSKNLVASDILIGQGAFSLTSVRKGNQKHKEITFPIFDKGDEAGQLIVGVMFTLHESGNNIDFVKAPDTEGRLLVSPKSAVLSRDVNLITKMDPLVTIRLGNENISSSVATDGGKNPIWKDSMSFQRENGEDILYIQVWSFSEFGGNDFLGSAYLSITEFLNLKEDVYKKIKLNYLNSDAGEITLAVTFQTSEPQKYNPPQQNQTPQQPQVQPPPQNQPGGFIQNVVGFVGNLIPVQQDGNVDKQYPNGDRYQGFFQGGMRNGQGKLTYAYGGYYQGQFTNDVFNGQGELVTGDTRYVGQFTNGRKNGQGIQEWQNGQKYNGQWLDNNMHGEGEWTFPNGQKKKGVWQGGNRTRWLDDAQNQLFPGRPLPQGGTINSSNGLFTLILQFDGRFYIMNNSTRQPYYQGPPPTRMINPPCWLRLEPHGSLVLIDQSGIPYWTSGMNLGGFGAPFVAVLQDDGRLVVLDCNGQPKWYSM